MLENKRDLLIKRVAILKELAIFTGLNDRDLLEVAERFLEYRLTRGSTLYEEGELAENFYIVIDGLLRCERVNSRSEGVVTTFEAGGAFGCRSYRLDGSSESRVKALRNTDLIYLPRPDISRILEEHPATLAMNIKQLAAGRKLNADTEFEWLEKDEMTHYVARRHPAYLWLRISRALILAILGFLSFYVAIGASAENQFQWVFAGAVLVFASAGWAIWEMLDWRNDYYVISNLRAVWLEQVLLRSNSRMEAPLENVQTVNTHTNLLGRILGFGDVIIHTYTGSIPMPAVGNAHFVKRLIEENVARLRKRQGEANQESIRQAVRETLGQQNGSQSRQPKPVLPTIVETERWQLFKTRTVKGNTIIYHKHWFPLFGSLLMPALFALAVFYGMRTLYGGLPTSTTGWLILFIFLVIPLGVMLYRILDWQNDIYMVTPDSLVDTEKKPLGSEVTKSASLANVLSLENHRVGIIGLLFNFGVVRINVGDSTLDFENIPSPARVQQEIFVRMEALKVKQERNKAEEERTRMTEWLRVYEQERGRSRPESGAEQ
ncbi:MAG: cyclic nucleotide-binding domain-containing protein [Anaerolineales bacterium]